MTVEPRPRHWLNLLLFVATVLTTTAHGALYVHGGERIWPLWDGWVYSLPLMAILLCHEFGHYFAARAHGLPASLPFFIPVPPYVGLLGTMGAVITQEATTDRKKLIDIGAAGPLAGLVVAIPVLWFGLTLSPVGPPSGLGGSWHEGNSILYAVLKRVATGEWLPNAQRDVLLHPTAMAGWAGLLVTMLNLIPIGQLDGGHVATAYFGNRYARAASVLHAALPVLAVGVFVEAFSRATAELAGFGGKGALSPVGVALNTAAFWVVWGAVLLLLKRLSGGQYHPPIDDTPLTPSRRALFWVVAVTFVLTFMPMPLRISTGRADITDKSTPTAAPP